MSTTAVIVAAGRGHRAGGDLPKQWRDLAGRTVAARAVAAFAGIDRIDRIIVVINPADREHARALAALNVTLVDGGPSRTASVRAGLDALGADCTRVLIHDAARPLVTPAVIGRVLDALDHGPAAAPALAVTDALWQGRDGRVIGAPDRTGLWRAQTPQGFDRHAIASAYAGFSGDAADDVEIALAAGMDIAIVAGEERNFKITTAADFDRAEELLVRAKETRTGTGFDVHRFGPGDSVTLCGIEIAHDKALVGHSDANVGMHALTDAIYGALALGDIGRHFPPSEPRWKGAASKVFLAHAGAEAAGRGYRLGNANVTLICETPKIGPHADAMRQVLAEILGSDPDRVSVKATTSEGLGFTGRGEGIAAMASVTLVRP